MDFDIFGKNIADEVRSTQSKDALLRHLSNLCFCTTWENRKH